MALTAVTLVGPVQSTASATASSSVSSNSSVVFINSGMIPFGYVNWDGITTTTTFNTYSNGNGQIYYTLLTSASSGGQPVNAFVYKGLQNFPSSNPAGLTYSNWWQINTPQTSGLSRTFRTDLVVGGVYSASFWHVQRANGNPAPTVFVVTIGGNTVWNTPPTSTSWYYVTTRITTVTSSSASLVFSASCVSSCNDYNMALSAVTLNGQMSLPVLPSVLSGGLLSHEYSTFDGYFTFGLQPGPGNSLGGISTLSSGTVLGPWTTSGTVLVYQTGASSSPFGGVANPYGGAYSIWLQSGSITRTFTNRVVGSSYMASFWYMKRGSTSGPTSFVVTLGGTVVWNQAPTLGGNTWVQVASSAAVATTSSITLSFVASFTDGTDRNMAINAITLIGPARYLHFDSIVTPVSPNYATQIAMGNTTGDWFVTTSVGAQVLSTANGVFIFKPGSTPSSYGGFTLTSNPGTMGLTYAAWFQTNSISIQTISRSFANAVVGGQYSLSFWFARRGTGTNLVPNSFNVKLANTVVWSTLPTSANWQYSVTRNATATQSFFNVAFTVQSTDTTGRYMAINAITIYQWPAASASSPEISSDGSKLFVGGGGQGLNDSNVYAMFSSNGSNAWQYNTGGAVKSSPASSTDGSTVFVGSDDTNMYALSAQTGTVKWLQDTNGEVQSSPAVTPQGVVVAPSLDGRVFAIATPANVNFSYTGSVQPFTVPFGVTSIQVAMAGASGGGVGASASGGAGGFVSTTIAVTPGSTYFVYVGGMGMPNYGTSGVGGFNGGGSGGLSGGSGGGGASDIRTANSLSSRIAVAGGGGGASSACGSFANGGNGGGALGVFNGANGTTVSCPSTWTPYGMASGGTLSAGGKGGKGSNGLLGVGGSQTTLMANVSYGGGGGGGYFGGGAGAYGGGAGGSSYCSAYVCSSTYVSVTNTGYPVNGYVAISYLLMPSVSNVITSFAGRNGASPGFAGDGSTNLLTANLNIPQDIAFDANGNAYIADTSNQRVRKAVANVDGTLTMTTFAGTGTAGFSGNGGPATSANLYKPSDIALDTTGSTLYICDNSGNRIRKVIVATGIISSYAGTGTASYAGDGGLATSASLWYPDGVVVDNSGNLYIADTYNHIIRFLKYSTGIITKYAGTASSLGSTGDNGAATSAKLNYPGGVTLDSSNNLYIADTTNQRIRFVNAVTNIITTIAGGGTNGYGGDFDFGIATSAAFSYPYRIAYDPWLNCCYIADSSNNRIRVLTSNGMLYTVAGSGVLGSSGDNGPPLAARLNGPLSIAVDTNGNVYVDDSSNNVIRQIIYNPNLVASTCVTGQYSCATVSSRCCSCPTGSYCVKYHKYMCPINTYNAMTGSSSAASCLACPSYMAAAAGSSVCSYLVNTIAGTGLAGSSGDSGPATVAMLNQPAAAVMDKSGNMYISVKGTGVGSSQIRKITNYASSSGANQIITHFAGNSNGINAVTDNVAASSAGLVSPSDIDVDLSGNVYIANTGNNNVRMISVVDGSISTVAGFVSSAGGYSGDGLQATSSYLNQPYGLFVDVSANIYIGDTYNHRVRVVKRATGIITTLAGNGILGSAGDSGSATSANLNYPRGLCLDSSENLYIADTSNNRIRVVINGIISTLAGNE